MKKLVLLMLLVSVSVFGQETYIEEVGAEGTTEKEFAYISKGYKEDAESGRDIINGYTVELISTNTTSISENKISISRTSSIYKLVRKETKETAAFMIKEVRKDNGHTNIFCLPNSNASNAIWTKARDIYVSSLDTRKCEQNGANFAYSWNMLMMFSKLMTNQ